MHKRDPNNFKLKDCPKVLNTNLKETKSKVVANEGGTNLE